MNRTNTFATRVACAAVSLIIACLCALVRLIMGHEFYTCVAVGVIACWAIFPSREDRKALEQAINDDAGHE